MIRRFCIVLGVAVALVGSVVGQTDSRERVRKMLADDFSALNRGEMTLSQLGAKARALAEREDDEVREMLLSGAVRLFERAGDGDGLAAARIELDHVLRPFVTEGESAVLHLGRHGTIEFAHCPAGSVEMVLDMTGKSNATVRLSREYWFMNFPLTRRASAYYPPLDPVSSGVTLDDNALSAYVSVNRAMAEGISRHFTERLVGKLPPGYVVRLPTLADWEYAFHAGSESGDFADLRRMHHNDEIGRRIYYDYDANAPRRQKARNAWGIGDWCAHEKVLDVIDASRLVRGSEDPDYYLVECLPVPAAVDPVWASTNDTAVSLIRMPSWVRWKAVSRGYGQDWCPMRLVIAPKLK